MKTADIKTIDVLTKTWFDKINGNTYFAQKIVINYGRKNEKRLINGFQYGYSSYDYFALQFVQRELKLKTNLNNYELCGSHGKIILRSQTIKNCKKRDLYNIGNE